jgi:hypothetical protein
MISNPATAFVTSSSEESFEYEGGSTLYHFSPKDNEMSTYRNMNIIFFADNEEHGLNVLRRMLEFHIVCARRYIDHKKGLGNRYKGQHDEYFSERKQRIIEMAQEYIFQIDNGNVSLELAPTNQMYKVGWASNDTLME